MNKYLQNWNLEAFLQWGGGGGGGEGKASGILLLNSRTIFQLLLENSQLLVASKKN